MATPKNSKLLRFGVVGVINTLLDFGIMYYLSVILGFFTVGANLVSTSIAFVFSFFANKKYTFKTTGTNIKREVALFIAVTLFGLWVLQSLVIWAIEPLLAGVGLSATTSVLGAKLIATVISLVWNYTLYDRVVFKQPQD